MERNRLFILQSLSENKITIIADAIGKIDREKLMKYLQAEIESENPAAA